MYLAEKIVMYVPNPARMRQRARGAGVAHFANLDRAPNSIGFDTSSLRPPPSIVVRACDT